MAHLVAVTGGTGYVATELIQQLLSKGYTVRATVRNTAKLTAEPLVNLGRALPGSLELVEADLLQPGSFDAAFQGCRYIFHTASPFFIDAQDPQSELVNVAVQGTRNVMQAAAKVAGLRRVILTSSCAAVKGSKDPQPPSQGSGAQYTEADWNETSTVDNGEAYWASKVQAEKLAWEMAKEHGIDLVTILPEFVMGPVISGRADGTSVGYMRAWVEGATFPGAPVFVDVRDVARAHVLAAETPSASGRYIVANLASTPPQTISAWLQERFPECEFGTVEGEEESKAMLDVSKVQKELGLAITPTKTTIVDMAVTMVVLGLATPKKKSGV